MLLRVHAEVALGEATGTMRLKEGAVAAIKNVHLGVGKLGIAESINPTVLMAHKFRPMIISPDRDVDVRKAYIRGARCAEYSQWNISSVFGDGFLSNSSSANCSFSQKFLAPSMCPPSYSYSNRQSMITVLSY